VSCTGDVGARENILKRIRAAQGRPGGEPTEAELTAIRETMREHEIGPLPGIALPIDQVGQFKSECVRLGSTYAELGSMADVPAAVGDYLAAGGLEKRVVLWHELATLDWQRAGVAIDDRPATGDDRTGLTGSFAAIAETGTVLLLSAPQWPKATALLPETHICIVRRGRLVDTMEEAFAMLRNEVGEPPRATFFVSGPSRTADIEQTIVIGAHGPYRVHVLLVP
jgi:L-lactate dehydrogenase complex protein LldG